MPASSERPRTLRQQLARCKANNWRVVEHVTTHKGERLNVVRPTTGLPRTLKIRKDTPA